MTDDERHMVIYEICHAILRRRLERMDVYRKRLMKIPEEELRAEYEKMREALK